MPYPATAEQRAGIHLAQFRTKGQARKPPASGRSQPAFCLRFSHLRRLQTGAWAGLRYTPSERNLVSVRVAVIVVMMVAVTIVRVTDFGSLGPGVTGVAVVGQEPENQ